MGMFRQKLDEVFAPGKEYSADELTSGPISGFGYAAEDMFERSGLSEIDGVEWAGARVKGPDGAGGYEFDLGVRKPDGSIQYVSAKDLDDEIGGAYTPEFDMPDWLDQFGIDMDYVKPVGRLYKYDAPLGTKDSFMKWESPLSEQPQGVADVWDRSGIPALTEQLNSIEESSQTVRNSLRDLKKSLGVNSWGESEIDHPAIPRMFAALESLRIQRDDVISQVSETTGVHPMSVPRLLSNRNMTGENMADLLMGGRPADATLADTAGLKAAGVPGMKNLAGSTGRSTYNYAIWDQDLLNQMRVRMIDGQRVPINPTTMSQQVEQRLSQAADSQLTSTMNPMALQAEPGIAAPAVAGAVYNALQAVNRYGGIQ
jgi:hypothetical protein